MVAEVDGLDGDGGVASHLAPADVEDGGAGAIGDSDMDPLAGGQRGGLDALLGSAAARGDGETQLPESATGVRNILAVTPVPMSKIRVQAAGVPSSRTQVATVYARAPARRSSARTTCPSLPLRATAPPVLPAVQEAPPVSRAALPWPVASAAVVPEVSSKRCQAAKAGGGVGGCPVSQYTL
ncbi:hypothetical protein GCM10017744_007890 [Streptomyces antimycoticus]